MTYHVALVDLDLRWNRIQQVQAGTFDPLNMLIYLYLSDNRLLSVDQGSFVRVVSLQHLDLSANQLSELPTEWLPTALLRLHVEDNPVRYYSGATFSGATSLTDVTFSSANATLESDTFAALDRLKIVEAEPYSRCGCDSHAWYLHTAMAYKVCDNRHTGYFTIRKYLQAECLPKPIGYCLPH